MVSRWRRPLFACSVALLCIMIGIYILAHLSPSPLQKIPSEAYRKRKDGAEGNSALWKDISFMLFFMGHGRSGSTLVGSILDAHPNIIVANEYNFIEKWFEFKEEQKNKDYLFQQLYSNSVRTARYGVRSQLKSPKPDYYNYHVPNQWQGKYDKVIKVIGDKKAKMFLKLLFLNRSMEEQSEILRSIQQAVEVPFKFIYILRNPFDIAATMIFRLQPQETKASERWKLYEKPRKYDKRLQIEVTKDLAYQINAAVSFMKRPGIEVINIYIEDVMSNPARELSKLCVFLSVPCSQDFLKDCASIVHGKPSNTRNTIIWDEDAKNIIYKITQQVELFKRYKFKEEI